MRQPPVAMKPDCQIISPDFQIVNKLSDCHQIVRLSPDCQIVVRLSPAHLTSFLRSNCPTDVSIADANWQNLDDNIFCKSFVGFALEHFCKEGHPGKCVVGTKIDICATLVLHTKAPGLICYSFVCLCVYLLVCVFCVFCWCCLFDACVAFIYLTLQQQ